MLRLEVSSAATNGKGSVAKVQQAAERNKYFDSHLQQHFGNKDSLLICIINKCA
jgi:hypothetical protein